MAAALKVLFERGYRGATSREIARVAGVNEVTLFRLFSTKDDLLAAALIKRSEVDRTLIPVPIGCLEDDLERLAEILVSALSAGGHLLLRVLPEISRLPAKQQEDVRKAIRSNQEVFASLFAHYQATGDLASNVGDSIWRTFIGPIMVAVSYAEHRQEPVQFDAHEHVQLFLHGCGCGKGVASD